MDDYIKREDAIRELNAEGYTKNMRIHKRILDIPAADVRENVRGHWTNVQISVTGNSMADCSICGATVHNSFMGNAAPNFCPNCGADMRGENDDKR